MFKSISSGREKAENQFFSFILAFILYLFFTAISNIYAMLNLSRHSDRINEISNKTVISEIGALAPKARKPRHMSVLESPNRRQQARQGLFSTVRQCPLKQQDKSAEATNLAVNILRYQLGDSTSQDRHLNNLRSNLQHRLKVARAENNEQLVTMLWDEFRQLETTA